MKILIAYGTKHEFAKKCSERLLEKLHGNIKLCNLKKQNQLDLQEYDKIIIGGSIYAGQIQKEVKEFCLKNLEELKKKKLGLFICGMTEGNKAMEQLDKVFPEELIKNAIVKENFGGEFVFSKMNFMEKFIIKKIAKTSEDITNLKEENIDKFAQKINDSK